MIGMDHFLEVIALDAADAVAAAEGGADRLEVVTGMDSDGLTPALATVNAIREAVDVPVRVMLRSNGGFRVSPLELDGIAEAARAFTDAGIDEFVFGFLTADGEVDVAAMGIVLEAADPVRWTFHRAFDYVADPKAAWERISKLPGVEAVLSAGSPDGIDVDEYAGRIDWEDGGPRWLVGGGLREEHVPTLRALGLCGFHIGSAARQFRRWDAPVSVEAVRRWRTLIDA